MSLPDDWWTTGLEDEPCDGCGVRPSKHAGHGSFTCKDCYDARRCPKCQYGLGPNHVCVTPEQHAKNQEELRKSFIEMGMDPSEFLD
jgi:hypothetical protein